MLSVEKSLLASLVRHVERSSEADSRQISYQLNRIGVYEASVLIVQVPCGKYSHVPLWQLKVCFPASQWDEEESPVDYVESDDVRVPGDFYDAPSGHVDVVKLQAHVDAVVRGELRRRILFSADVILGLAQNPAMLYYAETLSGDLRATHFPIKVLRDIHVREDGQLWIKGVFESIGYRQPVLARKVASEAAKRGSQAPSQEREAVAETFYGSSSSGAQPDKTAMLQTLFGPLYVPAC